MMMSKDGQRVVDSDWCIAYDRHDPSPAFGRQLIRRRRGQQDTFRFIRNLQLDSIRYQSPGRGRERAIDCGAIGISDGWSAVSV